MSGKDKALEIVQDAIEQSAEGLLDDEGVDGKAVKALAEEIVLDLRHRRLLVTEKPKATTHYLVVVSGDVEPNLWGPYATEEARDQAAKDHRKEDSDMNDGLYPLDVDKKGRPEIGSYCGSDLDEEDDKEAVEEKEAAG